MGLVARAAAPGGEDWGRARRRGGEEAARGGDGGKQGFDVAVEDRGFGGDGTDEPTDAPSSMQS